MVLGHRSSVRLQLVLRRRRARVLSVFVQAALIAVRVGLGANRHLKILFAFGRSVARQSSEEGHTGKE